MFALNMVATSSVQEPAQVALFYFSFFFSFLYVFMDLYAVLELYFFCCLWDADLLQNKEEN